jgi:hypothetical protein
MSHYDGTTVLRRDVSRRSPRFTLSLMTGLILTVSACGNSRTYWRNIDPNRSAYLQVDDAQCKMYSRANSSQDVVNPTTKNNGVNGGLVLLQAIGNAADAANLYTVCMSASGWSSYTVSNTPPQSSAPSWQESYNSARNRRDYAAMISILQPLAAQGNAWAQRNLGVMFERGNGVPQNYEEAVKWYGLSVAQGDAMGQSNLGSMYANGLGLARNYDVAGKWFRLSAAQGNASAQRNLGSMYANGLGVARNYDEAGKWLRLSAAQGDVLGQLSLGIMYANGLGVTRNYDEAGKWFRLSAAQGNADAQQSLARLSQRQ